MKFEVEISGCACKKGVLDCKACIKDKLDMAYGSCLKSIKPRRIVEEIFCEEINSDVCKDCSKNKDCIRSFKIIKKLFEIRIEKCYCHKKNPQICKRCLRGELGLAFGSSLQSIKILEFENSD